jgi:hypothetical protein
MKKSEVKIGGVYSAKVSDKVVQVRIDATNRHGGWNATNLVTKKKIRIKSAQRLRAAVKAPKTISPPRTAKPLDPNRCATPRCKGEPALTHLGKPLCQKCWDRLCEDDAPKSTAGGDGKRAKKAGARKSSDAKPKRMGVLSAAAQLLQAEGKPMRAKELIDAIAAKGLWTSPKGKTPEATLYAAMIREVTNKGNAARFKRVDRGLFAFNTKAAR